MSPIPVWKKLLKIVIGTGLLAFSVKCVYDPSHMVVGGFSGLAVLIKEISSRWIEDGIPLGLTTVALNVPFFCVACPIRGTAFIRRTILATLLLSLWLEVLPVVEVARQDFVLAAIFGGLTGGAGIGLVLSVETTTGGTDLLASILQPLFPEMSVARIMAVLDGVIILAGAFVFGFPSALYALAAVYVTARTTDRIVLGAAYARSVYIITEKPEEVSDVVLKQMNRGITGISARGMYTGNEKMILFCVLTGKEIIRLKRYVFGIDADAFVIVSEAQEQSGDMSS